MRVDASRLYRKVRFTLAMMGAIMGCLLAGGCGAEEETEIIRPGDIRDILLYFFIGRPGDEPKPSDLSWHVRLGQVHTQRIFQDAQYRETTPTWKGAYYCIASTRSGSERHVWLSIAPSGWFAIGGQKGYWLVQGSGRDEIEKILMACKERAWRSADDRADRVREADGPAPRKSGALYGYARQDGQWVIPPRFEDAMPFSEGLAAVRVGDANTGLWGYIDTAGTPVIKPGFAGASFFSDGLAVVTVDDYFEGKQGYIDRSGKMVIEPKLDLAREFRCGVATVVLDGKYVHIDRNGHVLNLEEASKFDLKEGVALIRVDGMRYGFWNATGFFVVPPVFEDARPFSEGLAAVKRNGKWGYTNKAGEVVIECKFDQAGPFRQGKARVVFGGRDMVVNTQGEITAGTGGSGP